jgi:hypothetical protein
MIKYFAVLDTGERNGSTMRQYISYPQFRKAYDSIMRKVLYSILIEFGVPMKLDKLFK